MKITRIETQKHNNNNRNGRIYTTNTRYSMNYWGLKELQPLLR